MGNSTPTNERSVKNSAILDIYLGDIRNKIQNEIGEIFHNSDIDIGLWTFKYNFNMEQLETFHFLPREHIGVNPETIKRLYDVKIQKGYGSIGYTAVSKKPHFVVDTFKDPRGTVLSIDEKIGQKYAVCFPIVDNENNNELLVIFDAFFDLDSFEIDVKESRKDVISALEKFFEKEQRFIGFIREYLELEKNILKKELLYKGFVDPEVDDIQKQNRFSKSQIHNYVLSYKYSKL